MAPTHGIDTSQNDQNLIINESFPNEVHSLLKVTDYEVLEFKEAAGIEVGKKTYWQQQ